jgi:peptidoglycan biosynthesis protein MviN/MurJ (putative lipid II flippase)
MSDKTPDDLLLETFKILKIIILFIVSNIAFNELFRNIDSDLWHEVKSEGTYLAFFYISFLAFYCISRLYENITSNDVYKVIVLRYLLIVMLATILFFQIDGLMNPDYKKHKLLSDWAINDLALIFVFFVLMVIFQCFYLFKKKIIKWYDVFCYIFMNALTFILIALNGIVILYINDIKIN